MGKKMSTVKREYNNAFDKLLVDADRGKLEPKLSNFMTRPAYFGTSLEQKTIFSKNICNECSYYFENEMHKEDCQYPWSEPQEYDIEVHPYLPCIREGQNEEE